MIERTSSHINSAPTSGVKPRDVAKDGGLTEPRDKVEISKGGAEQQPAKRPYFSKVARFGRKSVADIVGTAKGLFHAAKNIPLGVAEGVDRAIHPDKDVATRKKNLAKISTINSVLAGTAIGTMAFGPVGLVLGAITGYVGATIGNFLDNRSRVTDSFIEKVDARIDKQIEELPHKGDSTKFRKALNAAFLGGIAGAKEGWRTGKMSGSGTGAGLIEGMRFIAKDIKETAKAQREEQKRLKEAGKLFFEKERSLPGKAFRTAMGVVCGISGILMNAPGGFVEGSLEAVEVGFHRKEITKPLLLFATNAGKVLPPALAGAAIGGPPGAAIGTAIGLISASLTTVIDGKYGFNKGIIRRIDKAIEEVSGEGGGGSGYAVYHKASKGAIVGAYAGIKEGWTLGYKGGTEFADGLFETPLEAAKEDESKKPDDKKNQPKQLSFDFEMKNVNKKKEPEQKPK